MHSFISFYYICYPMETKTTVNFFSEDNRTALQAKEQAQWIAFAPMVFQASRILRDSGILAEISNSGKKGIQLSEIVEKVKLPHYGVRVLVEAGLGIGLILLNNGLYTISSTGFHILNDKLTRVNMDFSQDVCYQGLFFLEDSIKSQKPEGLKVLGDWPTIYEGLSKLPGRAKQSWFDFDHYYSDSAFGQALSKVLSAKPKHLLDIGGNTGKFAISCVTKDENVHVTIVDLPGQTEMAKKNIENLGLSKRVSFHQTDVLKKDASFPKNVDAIWMSQFLDCFSDDQIVSILERSKDAINDDGSVYVLETFWDRQRFEVSAFCLQMTSLYFTAMANGNSQMYDSKVFIELIEKAGLKVLEITDRIGVSHTLLRCKKA